MREDLLRLFPALAALPAGAYVVGGAIRDLLRGATPADVDVACNDPRAFAATLGRRVIRLGQADHIAAWRVVTDTHVYDFAEILDHAIDADLARRDFTINAMAVDLQSGALLDPHGGRADLAGRVVRMVNPTNFDDDPLRMLKAVRMAVTLDFAIDRATIDAIRPRAAAIQRVAAERVMYELTVIFSAARFRRAVELLRETELDRAIFGHTLPRFDRDDVPLAAAFALLVEQPRAFAERWRWSDVLLRDVTNLQHLAKEHPLIALYEAGPRVAPQLPAMLGRDVAMPDFGTRALLDGDEIARIAGVDGPAIGRLKRALLEAQLEGKVRTREEAEAFVTNPASS